MNHIFTVAASLATIGCVTHLQHTRGQISVVLEQGMFDSYAKVLLRGVVSYLGIFHLLSTLMLWACALTILSKMQAYSLVSFIALNYLLFAVWQCYGLVTSGIQAVGRRQWHWLLYFAIAITSQLGLYFAVG